MERLLLGSARPSKTRGLALSLVVVACGGATVDPPGATSTASTSPPSTPDSAPTPNVCNAPFNAAPAVLEMEVPIEPPEPTGGVVTDGTYHLVDVAFDTGTGGQARPMDLTQKETLAIHGTTFDATSELITKFKGKAEGHSFSFVTLGTTFTSTETCPNAGGVRLFRYSATPSSLVLYTCDDVNGGTVVHTYVR